MIRRPQPKILSPEEQSAVNAASFTQAGQTARAKSYDADFPVFEVPVNQKVLVYIPNHTMPTPEGGVGLRMDKFAAHPVLDGRSFADIRCTQGVVSESLGLDGSCPLCDAVNECWDLYHYQYADIARSKGIDPTAPEARDLLKEDSKNLLNNRAVKSPEVWYVFPIVVIACTEKDGRWTVIPKKDAEGRISGKAQWYAIRERTYLEKWGAAFDALTEEGEGGEDNNPAGHWAILNYCYSPKNGSPNKMGSAKSLNVTFKAMAGYEKWAEYFDKMTVEWDIVKSQQTVVIAAIRDMMEMNEVTADLMKNTRNMISMYQLAQPSAPALPGAVGGTPTLPKGSADSTLANFGATPVAGNSDNTGGGEMPLTGEMPNDGVE